MKSGSIRNGNLIARSGIEELLWQASSNVKGLEGKQSKASCMGSWARAVNLI